MTGLRRAAESAEWVLAVDHETRGMHDVLGADFTCKGCAVLAELRAALAVTPEERERFAANVRQIRESAERKMRTLPDGV